MLRLAFLAAVAMGIPIDNGLIGEPEVQCGPTSIQFSFAAQNPFSGVVYAKNHYGQGGCAVAGESSVGGGLELPFETCNVRRIRSLEPRGIFVTATVVVQFHPLVVTKVDRAFHLRCFYMEADKTVDAEIEVSMLTTELRTFQVPMPVCRYQILDADTLEPVRFVTIGAPILHQWICDTETVDTFCMEVYGCYVDDASNAASRIDLVDEEGCSLDGNLMPNIEYLSDLMGAAQAHVFKFADRPQLYFNCQIRIGIKEPNGDCFGFRGAACAEPQLSNGRRKRSAERPEVAGQLGFLDVTPVNPVYVADVELSSDDIPAHLRSVLNHSEDIDVTAPSTGTCLSTSWVAGGVVVLAVLIVATATLALKLCLARSK